MSNKMREDYDDEAARFGPSLSSSGIKVKKIYVERFPTNESSRVIYLLQILRLPALESDHLLPMLYYLLIIVGSL